MVGLRWGTSMADLLLSESRQAALRSLLAADAVPGRPLPPKRLLETVATLVPCDIVNAGLTDGHGRILEHLVLAPGPNGRSTVIPSPWPEAEYDEDDAPMLTGWLHWSRNPRLAEKCGGWLGTDDLTLGFLNGVDHVVQIGFVRETSTFSEEELALFRMLFPVLERLVRERPTPYLPPSLTVSERRVLHQVAAGRSNREIAGLLWVAESTVRKHLENAYRKLGVSNRMAAVVRMNGCRESDLKGSLERFAGTRMGPQESSI